MVTGVIALLLVLPVAQFEVTTPSDPAPQGEVRSDAGAIASPDPTRSAEPAARFEERGYVVGPRDSIQLRVIGFPEFDTTASVSGINRIILPILGEMTIAPNTTVAHLEAQITTALADGYVREPRVRVEVAGYRTVKVWLLGEVPAPGELALTPPTTLLELIRQIGSVGVGSGKSLTIERTPTDDSGARAGETGTIIVDLKALLVDGDLTHNIPLENGDKIYVGSTTSMVSAFGEVSKPGFYPFREGLRVADLIALAGGFTEFANAKKVKVRRSTEQQELRVNLKDFYGKGDLEENIPLAEGDMVVVNSSFFF